MVEWFKKRWAVISEAAGVRRHILGYSIFAVSHGFYWVIGLFGITIEEVEMILGLPAWAISCFVLLILVAWWILEYVVKLKDQQEPKLKIEYDENDPLFLNPEKYIKNHNKPDTIERRALVLIRNLSSCKTVEDVEIYCEKIEVLDSEGENYKTVVRSGRRPVPIHPGSPYMNGLVRQVVGPFHGTNEIFHEFDVQVISKYPMEVLYGTNFKMTVLVEGKDTECIREEFKFGEKDGKFYCRRIDK